MERRYNKQPKLNIRKGDIVKVISGDSKGQQGKVLEVIPAERKVLVEKVNMVSKATRPNAQNTQGGIVRKEAPINMSKVMLVDPKGGKPTRIGRKVVDGKLVRYAKKSGEVIKQ
jgi:large subunit ribosomal protein L24